MGAIRQILNRLFYPVMCDWNGKELEKTKQDFSMILRKSCVIISYLLCFCHMKISQECQDNVVSLSQNFANEREMTSETYLVKTV